MALVPFPGSKSAARYTDPDDEPDDLELDADGAGGKMSFLDHLDELRRRLIWAIGAVGAGSALRCSSSIGSSAFIMKPLVATLPPGRTMIYTEPTEAFMLQLKVAALAGLIVAAPAVMLQLWLFIAPGLYKREKRMALPFVISSSMLFVAGAAFNHYVVFPTAFAFLGSFRTSYMEFLPRISPVFSLYAQLALAFGVIFQMPVLVFTLARLGPRDRGLPVAEHEVRDPHHLHHLRRRDPDERRRHADAHGGADDPALPRSASPLRRSSGRSGWPAARSDALTPARAAVPD